MASHMPQIDAELITAITSNGSPDVVPIPCIEVQCCDCVAEGRSPWLPAKQHVVTTCRKYGDEQRNFCPCQPQTFQLLHDSEKRPDRNFAGGARVRKQALSAARGIVYACLVLEGTLQVYAVRKAFRLICRRWSPVLRSLGS